MSNKIKKTNLKMKKDFRIIVYKSNRHIYAQLLKNDGLIVGGASVNKGEKRLTIKEEAVVVGEKIAEIAKKNKIKEVIFDRNGYKYHGIIKILLEKAKSKGIHV